MAHLYLQDRSLELLAKTAVNIDYQPEPILTCPSLGAIIHREESGAEHTLDFRPVIKRAWTQALQALAEQGIDTTKPYVQKPFLAQITTTGANPVGIYLTKNKLVVSAWMVELGELGWTLSSSTFLSSALSKKFQPRGTAVALGYTTVYDYSVFSETDKSIYLTAGGNDIYIKNSAYTSAADLKASLSGVMMLYPLAQPVEVELDTELNLTLSNVGPLDTIRFMDIDGQEMATIRTLTGADVTADLLRSAESTLTDEQIQDILTKHPRITDIFPNEDWVKTNHTFPGQLIFDTLRGLGIRFDFAKLVTMDKRLHNIEQLLIKNNII